MAVDSGAVIPRGFAPGVAMDGDAVRSKRMCSINPRLADVSAMGGRLARVLLVLPSLAVASV